MMMISDLPYDLELEILARVPSKSLWELKMTCKRWYTLFRDPRFIEKNKKMGKAVRELMLLMCNKEIYSIAGGFETPIELTGKLRNLKGSKDLDLCDIFHCDGLMLCSTEGSTRLVVWNPCTGQTRLIKPRTCYLGDDAYALGYSTSSSSSGHNYKVLRGWYYENDQKVRVAEFEIYDLSSDSWRVIGSFTRDYYLYCISNGTSLKGDAYFLSGSLETPAGVFLMKFDFTTERFVRLPLPFPSLDLCDQAVLSVVRDEKLSVLHIDVRSNVLRIWMSDDEEAKDLSWRSNFVLKVDFGKFKPYVESFLLDEENKVVLSCDFSLVDYEYKTRIFIVGEDMFKQVYNGTVKVTHLNSGPRVITYVPSLVRIQSEKYT